jgi:hypothetical protein
VQGKSVIVPHGVIEHFRDALEEAGVSLKELA